MLLTQKIQTIGQPDAKDLLIQLVDDHDLALLESEAQALRANVPSNRWQLMAIPVSDWFTDLSPWPAPPVFGRQTFGDGAGQTLQALRESVLDTPSASGRRISICGYSLAGLFALWAACQTERFSGVAAVSPSVWYPGWLDYLRAHPLRAQRVYLSLGDREEKTRNPVMATVGSALRETQALLTAAGIETQLDWNPGNHFVDSDKRTARGMAWLTGNDRIPTAYTP